MGIYIKGMEMPQNCLQCYCTDSEYGECVLDTEKRCPDDYKKRADWCPLVELPPHGDLISREWLVVIGQHLMNIAKNDDIANGVKWLWQYVIEAQTIIEAEGRET